MDPQTYCQGGGTFDRRGISRVASNGKDNGDKDAGDDRLNGDSLTEANHGAGQGDPEVSGSTQCISSEKLCNTKSVKAFNLQCIAGMIGHRNNAN